MRYLPSDKYNIAWFKLAECVARGERERALGLHRLLAHSFDDYAFAVQLEGDIFLAFDDCPNALIKYHESLHLYKASNRMIEAIALGEHILMLSPEKYEPLEMLVSLYELINLKPKLELHLYSLFSLMIGKQEFEQASEILAKISLYFPQSRLKLLREQLIIASLATCIEPPLFIQEEIKMFVSEIVRYGESHALAHFLEQLKMYNERYFAVADECLKDDKL